MLSRFTPEMETKLQGMETLDKIDPKQDGLGPIYLIRDVTHIGDETAREMLDIFQVDKDLMLCHKKIARLAYPVPCWVQSKDWGSH